MGLADNPEIIYCQAEIHTVVAEINMCAPQSSTTFDLPVYVEGDVQTMSLPVIFEDLQIDEMPNIGDLTLKEVSAEELPSELWNSEVNAMFLPQESSAPQVANESNASASRILTSSEIIQAKREKEQIKEKKAKAVEERKKENN